MGNFFVCIRDDPQRAEMFCQAGLDPGRAPVVSPVARWARLPGRGWALVYELAIGDLTVEQRQRLAELLARRFGLPVEEVVRDLEVVGCPILAAGCVVIIEYAWGAEGGRGARGGAENAEGEGGRTDGRL